MENAPQAQTTQLGVPENTKPKGHLTKLNRWLDIVIWLLLPLLMNSIYEYDGMAYGWCSRKYIHMPRAHYLSYTNLIHILFIYYRYSLCTQNT